MTAALTDLRRTDSGQLAALIGRRVQRTWTANGDRRRDEGRVAMVVPSRRGDCLMVTRQDDSVDVWYVGDTDSEYQVLDDYPF
ncbi:hypothetical protein [Gordonia rhizosphera]|uniref:Uncharacterized protein n=1 Tax=Gordonia rhizosphera NBRC 16068 TaxID=1108045 RepID=K6W572_9ACTN|nr:hypothetical protein [Gordonia rhizosphera]GAB88836.1 hypothetical protein GORHZ_045_00070 [Gordonia rhizosphera NBRC 16068]